MADATIEHDAVQGLAAGAHGAPGAYESPLFGAYSKKVGMWLFLASDSLTFGALTPTPGRRLSTRKASPMPRS
jgi:heme/copper-type cytochrome/quinol oxidase subunit 3